MESDANVGTLFADRFRIKSVLGRGGMGVVYLAEHEVLERPVAIKLIHDNLITDGNVAARFRREARAASRIDHPNITSVFDYGHYKRGRPYIVMDYVEGESLEEVVGRLGPMPIARAGHILHQVADALAAAHACGVVHRDLSPRNVMLTLHRGRPDYVKILDFGLAKILGLSTSANLSTDGQLLGTPTHMAPEQCRGDAIDAQTDVYAFGALAFEALVGRPPFTGSLLEVISAHIHAAPEPPSRASGRGDISPAWDDLVLQCLAKQPADRPAGGQELVARLAALVKGGAATQRPSRSAIRLMMMPPPGLADRANSPERATEGADGPLDEYDSTAGLESSAGFDSTIAARLEEPSEPLEGPTVADWPSLDEEGARERRSRAVEELACACRDRGIGSQELTRLLAAKVAADDQAFEVDAQLAMLTASEADVELRARERESRLRQALTQLELERGLAGEGPEIAQAQTLNISVQEALDSEVDQALAVQIREIADKIREIGRQRDIKLAEIDQQKRQLGDRIERLRHEQDALALQLRTRIREQAPELAKLEDPEVDRLITVAFGP